MKPCIGSVCLCILLLTLRPVYANDAADLLPLIGQRVYGYDMRNWLSTLGESPKVVKVNNPPSSYYIFKKHGLSFRLDRYEEVTSFFLYAEGTDGYSQYQGKLPLGLSFAHTRQQIESLLGKPSKVGGGGMANYWVVYETIDMVIGYNTKSYVDFNARIAHVVLLSPTGMLP
jgi:hypothetical protein